MSVSTFKNTNRESLPSPINKYENNVLKKKEIMWTILVGLT